MRTAMENSHQSANISGRCISSLRYADDVALIAEDKDSLQDLLLKISDVSQVYSLDINVKKTKVMTCAKNEINIDIQLYGEAVGTSAGLYIPRGLNQ